MFIHFACYPSSSKSFRIYVENFHPCGLRKWEAPNLSGLSHDYSNPFSLYNEAELPRNLNKKKKVPTVMTSQKLNL